MKKTLSLILALTLIVTALAGVSFAADPIAVATIAGAETELAELSALYDAVGNVDCTKIVLKQDIEANGNFRINHSMEIDLGGHTITGAAGKHVFQIYHEENVVHATFKNGTIIGSRVPIYPGRFGYMYAADVVLEDMVIVAADEDGKKDGALVIETALDPSLKNVIKNSTLISVDAHPIKAIQGCKVELGTGVKLYAISDKTEFYSGAAVLSGETATAGTATSVTVNGIEYADLVEWTTPASPATPADPAPSTPADPAPSTPADPAPSTPADPAPEVPSTNVPDVDVPKTGASVIALGVMAMVSLAGAVVSKKH